jgi:hypothetical protein
VSDLDTSNPEDYCIQHGGVMESGHIDCLASMPEYDGRNDGTSAPEQSPERCSADQGDDQCQRPAGHRDMHAARTPTGHELWGEGEAPSTNTLKAEVSPDDEWLVKAIEDGARAMYAANADFHQRLMPGREGLHQRLSWEEINQYHRDLYRLRSEANILPALPHITGGIADAIEADGFAGYAHNGNEVRWASGVARNFWSEVSR